MSSDKEERKDAYRKAFDSNKWLSIDILMSLNKKTRNKIDKYLYAKNRYSTWQSCFELWKLIRTCGGDVPVLLQRIIVRSFTRSDELAIKLVEEGVISITKHKRTVVSNTYLYRGKQLKVREIANNTGVSYGLVVNRISEFNSDN